MPAQISQAGQWCIAAQPQKPLHPNKTLHSLMRSLVFQLNFVCGLRFGLFVTFKGGTEGTLYIQAVFVFDPRKLN